MISKNLNIREQLTADIKREIKRISTIKKNITTISDQKIEIC